MLDFSTFSAFKFCIDKQYCWSPLQGLTPVLALPLILCISLRIKFCVYVASSSTEILQTDEVCVTEKISVTEYFNVNPLTLELIKDT